MFEEEVVVSVVNLTLLYIDSEAVIPVKVGNPVQIHWIPGQARNDKCRKEISELLH